MKPYIIDLTPCFAWISLSSVSAFVSLVTPILGLIGVMLGIVGAIYTIRLKHLQYKNLIKEKPPKKDS